jgi:hypothetical protein
MPGGKVCYCNQLTVNITNIWAASKKGDYALMFTVFKSLKGPLLAIVFPRLCFIGFTFCQPFLISVTLRWAERDSNSDDMSQGYGLIGAWFLVFIGLAVSPYSKQI